MKKRSVLVVLIIIGLGLFMAGCEMEPEVQLYDFDSILIQKTAFDAVPLPTVPTFDAVKIYWNSLKARADDSDFDSGTCTEDELRDLLDNGGMSLYQIDGEISFLNTVGNNVFTFEYRHDAAQYLVLYVEK
jgi:hypothetical protein